MSTRSTLRIPVAGDELDAWWYPSQRSGAEPAPCVVLAHGFGGIKEMRLAAYAERFADAGISALVFDYRHFGASSGEPRELLDVAAQLADWRAAVEVARARPDVDGDRVALWGTSFSGGLVVLAAAADPRIAAVVAQAPMADGRAALLATPPRHGLRLTAAAVADRVGAWRGRPPRRLRAAGEPGDAGAVMTTPDALGSMLAMVPDGVRFENAVCARVMLRVGLLRPVVSASQVRCSLLVQVMDHDAVTPPGPAATMASLAPHGELLAYPGGHFDSYLGPTFETVVADQTAFLERVLLK